MNTPVKAEQSSGMTIQNGVIVMKYLIDVIVFYSEWRENVDVVLDLENMDLV
jgi:hypothetical protein